MARAVATNFYTPKELTFQGYRGKGSVLICLFGLMLGAFFLWNLAFVNAKFHFSLAASAVEAKAVVLNISKSILEGYAPRYRNDKEISRISPERFTGDMNLKPDWIAIIGRQ
jgi:hypothetical protein